MTYTDSQHSARNTALSDACGQDVMLDHVTERCAGPPLQHSVRDHLHHHWQPDRVWQRGIAVVVKVVSDAAL